MKETRYKKPGREDWASLCSGVMRAEYELERLAESRTATDEHRRRAIADALDELAREPACRWLLRQRGYEEALRAFTRYVGASPDLRFEFLSAIAYAMETSCSVPPEKSYAPPARALQSAVRHARQLAAFLARHGAGPGQEEEAAGLRELLERYVARHRRAGRASSPPAVPLPKALRFGRDVALLLIAGCGSAPPSVVRPLVRLAGGAPAAHEVAALLREVKREAKMMAEGDPRSAGPVLDRIAIVPTRQSRRATRTLD